MSAAISFISPGRPGRRHSDVHFWAISRRYQRRLGSGVTMVATYLKTWRPSRWPFAARQRPWSSVNGLAAPSTAPKSAVLLHQVSNHVLLVTIDPPSPVNERKPHGVRDRPSSADPTLPPSARRQLRPGRVFGYYGRVRARREGVIRCGVSLRSTVGVPDPPTTQPMSRDSGGRDRDIQVSAIGYLQ
jgi:hypothetical protein